MSDEKNEIVTREKNHIEYIDKNLDLIQNQNKLSNDDLRNFAIQCKRTGLDPVTRQIYAIPNNGKLTIMASIDGLRLIAERSGAYEGQTKPEWCGEDGRWTDIWLSNEPPKAARIGVYKTKFREALYGVALFNEYVGRHLHDDLKYGKFKKGDFTFMWAKMPALMIVKVAEALALRKAFPNEMSGLYSTDEMEQATIINDDKSISIQNVSTIKEVLKETGFDNLDSKPKKVTPEVINHSNELADYIIKFGKHKDKKLSEINLLELDQYVQWIPTRLASSEGAPINGKLKEYMEECCEVATIYVREQYTKVPPNIDT